MSNAAEPLGMSPLLPGLPLAVVTPAHPGRQALDGAAGRLPCPPLPEIPTWFRAEQLGEPVVPLDVVALVPGQWRRHAGLPADWPLAQGRSWLRSPFMLSLPGFIDAVGAPVAVDLAGRRAPRLPRHAVLGEGAEHRDQVGGGSSSSARVSARRRQASSRPTACRSATRSAWASSHPARRC